MFQDVNVEKLGYPGFRYLFAFLPSGIIIAHDCFHIYEKRGDLGVLRTDCIDALGEGRGKIQNKGYQKVQG